MKKLIFVLMLVGGCVAPGAPNSVDVYTGQCDSTGQGWLEVGTADDIKFWCIENQRSWPKPVQYDADTKSVRIDCGPFNWWRFEVTR